MNRGRDRLRDLLTCAERQPSPFRFFEQKKTESAERRQRWKKYGLELLLLLLLRLERWRARKWIAQQQCLRGRRADRVLLEMDAKATT